MSIVPPTIDSFVLARRAGPRLELLTDDVALRARVDHVSVPWPPSRSSRPCRLVITRARAAEVHEAARAALAALVVSHEERRSRPPNRVTVGRAVVSSRRGAVRLVHEQPAVDSRPAVVARALAPCDDGEQDGDSGGDDQDDSAHRAASLNARVVTSVSAEGGSRPRGARTQTEQRSRVLARHITCEWAGSQGAPGFGVVFGALAAAEALRGEPAAVASRPLRAACSSCIPPGWRLVAFADPTASADALRRERIQRPGGVDAAPQRLHASSARFTHGPPARPADLFARLAARRGTEAFTSSRRTHGARRRARTTHVRVPLRGPPGRRNRSRPCHGLTPAGRS